MKQTPLFSGIIYAILGTLFTYFAIQNVNNYGWGFFTFFFILLATLDYGSAIRLIAFHFRWKQQQRK
ncbi:YdiK family protein [Aeribacillus pallidus]|jgi:hypothetical protein|uniref:YdiK family protein n=1 Tax=Aeribacillus pallidus TaxID=33936 RepID=UPI001DB38579|nr:YdiK family protein [Bacillus sp. (in: firmicutes)]